MPFDPSVIKWLVTNTAKDLKRGQGIPYADQRAYTDRLNVLITPSGWTGKYILHTRANFRRAKDQKTVAKVFVTGEATLFNLGSPFTPGENGGRSQCSYQRRGPSVQACLLLFWAGTIPRTTSPANGLIWMSASVRRACISFPVGRPRRDGDKAFGRNRKGQRAQTVAEQFRKEGWPRNDQGADPELFARSKLCMSPWANGLYRGLLKANGRI